jgi:predicted dithiol-disulfide oxidoreductase (DUF899 family)
MGHRFTAERYTKQRAKMLKEEMSLVFQREKVNKALRALRASMHDLDTALINSTLFKR